VGSPVWRSVPAPALSGGQQQPRCPGSRAGFFAAGFAARRAAEQPRCQLREEMRRGVKEFAAAARITVLFVTHDQIEALSLSDRIAIMQTGQLEQVGALKTSIIIRRRRCAGFPGQDLSPSGKILGIADQQIKVAIQQFDASRFSIQRTIFGFRQRFNRSRPVRDGRDPTRAGRIMGQGT